MYFYKLLFFLLIFPFSAQSDQNDYRLDKLFEVLANSQDVNVLNTTTAQIWGIWLETNDIVIKEDFKLGLEFMKNGQLKNSIQMFSKVIKKKSSFAEAWNKRATVFYMLGDFDSSILDIKETLKREPRHFGAMDGLGIIFIRLEEYEKAINVYNEMLKIIPYNPSAIQKRDFLENLLINKV